ncbi:Bromodomain-containing protein [Phlegmacium glaucopus]|nr:Bromodomain-containing protein [Phlegmacium glaucopus]
MSLKNINSSPGPPFLYSCKAQAQPPTDQNSQSVALSPASSLLSEVSQHNPTKKRRVSSSSLSDAEDIDDEEEDKPLAARITVGVRSVPGKRSGKQVPGKKSKKSHAALSGPSSTNNRPKVNGKVNGVNGHETKVKVEDKMDENQLSRLTAGVPMDAVGRSSAGPPVRTEKPSLIEMRNGLIQVTPVENDQQPRSLIILTGLKTLFQKQLPKMPREYIARLVYDNNSKSLAIIKQGYKVVGGICYRPFAHRGFAEIVFFATNSADQEKGYGGMLMDHFKAHIRKTYPEMMHFLTYADNFAVGYFEKQGFSKEISLDRSVWAGYIKDYEGGTIMQCTMLPKIDYLDKFNIFKQQQESVMSKIRQLSKSHIVHPGLPQFHPEAPPNVTVDPKDVPGLKETGWSPEMEASMARPTAKTAAHSLMERIINELLNNSRAWAFREPVNVEEVVDYLEFVKEPMDLSTIERKVSHNQYKTFDAFVDDVQLVFDNARLYNPEESVYYKNANQVEIDFQALLGAR